MTESEKTLMEENLKLRETLLVLRNDLEWGFEKNYVRWRIQEIVDKALGKENNVIPFPKKPVNQDDDPDKFPPAAAKRAAA